MRLHSFLQALTLEVLPTTSVPLAYIVPAKESLTLISWEAHGFVPLDRSRYSHYVVISFSYNRLFWRILPSNNFSCSKVLVDFVKIVDFVNFLVLLVFIPIIFAIPKKHPPLLFVLKYINLSTSSLSVHVTQIVSLGFELNRRDFTARL